MCIDTYQVSGTSNETKINDEIRATTGIDLFCQEYQRDSNETENKLFRYIPE